MKASRLLIVAPAAALAFSLYLYSAAASSAPQAAQDQPPPPTFRTGANYVRVDVYPTRDDAPVADLTQADFEVLDNGQPQKIEQFERVIIRAAGPQETRVEPNNVREMRSMLESSRARVFVLFLDTAHVDVAGSQNIRKPLVDALDRVIGVDDLVGVMTPEMSARDIAFGRKTTTIDGMLTRYWYWGERGRLNPVQPEEQEYQTCYLGLGPTPDCPDDDRGVAAEMINRRREKRTLDALADLVAFLQGVREERKAVLAITDGWLLYQRNPFLARRLNCRVPTGPRIGVDPRTGKLATDAPRGGEHSTSCEADRLELSEIDHEQQFRRLQDQANRANTSFYPIDPRGLPVFDTPIVEPLGLGPPPPMTPLAADAAMLRARLSSLRTLAEATDGLAIINTNNLAAGFKRVADDLSSYYLLGYYASGKLDGKFHAITVRMKRPGVRVRARRGYLAASEKDVSGEAPSARATAAAAPTPAAAAEARAIDAAVAPLEGFTRQLPVRVYAAAGWKPGNVAAVWMVGELGVGPEWKSGADVDLMLTNAGGAALASSRARVEPGGRGFRAALAPAEGLPPGDYIVRVRVRSSDAIASASEALRIALPEAPAATGAVFVRRGPSTGNREVATSDLRFRRGDQLKVEVPTPSDAAVGARLLDRTGKPLNVPVTASVRDDADGSRWQVAQIALAPLAPSDYVIEMTAGGTRTLMGFRVIP